MNIERRDRFRNTTRESVRFDLGGIRYAGVMRNLSQRGCMIEAPDAFVQIGWRCEVTLRPDMIAAGRIAWQLGDSIGISFLHSIPESVVRQYALDDWSMRSAHRHQNHNPTQHS